ncbi:ricin-type beta-trefoil lectin domain protein [Streptomyces kaempferi]|uniref:Ricin-type beta-trefoil lectin domain protein n=1 Tax=Streptomyces kaempferi TaxID=333725 RepID=A0ABW3XVM4_9ACTN
MPSRVFEFTGDKLPTQSKSQDPPLLDGASSRFADAFTRRTTKIGENGSIRPRPWTWIAGAGALTICVLLILFAVAKFPSGSDDTNKTTASSSAAATTPSTSQQESPRDSSAVSAQPDTANAAKNAAGLPAGGPGGDSTGVASPSGRATKIASASRPTESSTTPQKNGSAAEAKSTTYPGVAVYSHASGRCVAATGSSSSKAVGGTRLEIWDCASGSWQKIDFRSDGTARMFGLCVTIAHASQDDGAAIQLTTCNGSWAQQFNLNSAHDLVNTKIGKCVDVLDNGTANGTKLQLWTCTGADNQKWSKR